MSHATLPMEQSLKRQAVEDRRKVPRFDASAIPGFKSINQVGGPGVKLINISRRGALIESRERMLPGSSISLQIVTAEAVHIIKGRIIRCSISSIDELQHQSAIALDEDFTLLPECPDAD